MVYWILIIVALAIFQILGFSFSFPEEYIGASSILVLVAALGMLHRVYTKHRAEKKKNI